MGIPTGFQTLETVPLQSPDGRQLPAVRAVQGDCERAYLCVSIDDVRNATVRFLSAKLAGHNSPVHQSWRLTG